MKFQLHFLNSRIVSTLLCGTAVAACGGGAAPTAAQSAIAASDSLPPTTTAASMSTSSLVQPSLTAIATAPITDVRVENTNPLAAQTNVPITFGQVFAESHLAPGVALVGRLDDGTTIPLQLDVKATHPNGSVRHAVISGVVPSLAVGTVRTISLLRKSSVQGPGQATPDALLAAGFDASVRVNIGGVEYFAAADQLLKTASRTTWLSGPVANEWQVSAPLVTAAGVQHPHLSARFAVRWYDALKMARVDVTVENDWAYEPAPQNFTYDATVLVGGKAVYVKPGLTHLHHARWRKLFWWGGSEPQLNIKHNTSYLIATRALPNYDQTITVPESALAALKIKWTGARSEPMAVGMAQPYMPTTGGRDDIGLLPGWAAQYLLSMDQRAKEVTLGTADLAGSWSAHYRDRNTDKPVSLIDFPFMTILGNPGDTYNAATKKREAFPECATTTACVSPNHHDTSHQPNFAYLPYLVTGDYYYLEELQFWAMWNVISYNPGYRDFAKGLVKSDQVRGQGWTLRLLSEAAYISPDNDRLKAHFAGFVANNLDWYNQTYTNNASANALGAIVHGSAAGYANNTGIAPWMDDFVTAAVGHTAELGFAQANPLLSWKAKFPIMRMTGAGACWIEAAIYAMIIKDSSTSPVYSTMQQVYQANHTPQIAALACGGTAMAAALGLKVGEMNGYAWSTTGYPSNMQPALAYSADVGGQAGADAWKLFAARSVKPDYGPEPQFAIVPRRVIQ